MLMKNTSNISIDNTTPPFVSKQKHNKIHIISTIENRENNNSTIIEHLKYYYIHLKRNQFHLSNHCNFHQCNINNHYLRNIQI